MSRWLNERSVDCCFCAYPEAADFDWIPVFEDELVAWLPKDHPLAHADAFPIENLEKEPFIHTSPNHDTDQDRLLAAFHLHPQTLLLHERCLHYLQHGRGRTRHQLQSAPDLSEMERRGCSGSLQPAAVHPPWHRSTVSERRLPLRPAIH